MCVCVCVCVRLCVCMCVCVCVHDLHKDADLLLIIFTKKMYWQPLDGRTKLQVKHTMNSLSQSIQACAPTSLTHLLDTSYIHHHTPPVIYTTSHASAGHPLYSPPPPRTCWAVRFQPQGVGSFGMGKGTKAAEGHLCGG